MKQMFSMQDEYIVEYHTK